jgi:hypothetical protein
VERLAFLRLPSGILRRGLGLREIRRTTGASLPVSRMGEDAGGNWLRSVGKTQETIERNVRKKPLELVEGIARETISSGLVRVEAPVADLGVKPAKKPKWMFE